MSKHTKPPYLRDGAEHLKAAHALAGDMLLEESGTVRSEDGGWHRPTPTLPQYKIIGKDVGEQHGSIYRFYCTLAAWPYSPAARSGVVL